MTPRTARPAPARRPRAFSIVEMLLALAISGALLAASLSALDTSFKGYQRTTDSASTHVVARIVMHRVMSMIRTGSEFGPYPSDPIATPVITSNFIEFVSFQDDDSREVTRIEQRAVEGSTRQELWYVQVIEENGDVVETRERPLLRDLENIGFTLEYDVGPRLLRATVDLTVVANDDLSASALQTGQAAPPIRLVSSTSPRQLDRTQP